MTGDGKRTLGQTELRSNGRGRHQNENPQGDDRDSPQTMEADNQCRNVESQLRFTLMKRNKNLRSLQKRFKKLRKQHQDVQAENESLRVERQEILSREQDVQQSYDFILERFVAPYAEKKNLRYDAMTLDDLNAILVPLLHDALQANSLRHLLKETQAEIENLTRDAHVSRNEVHALQNELQVARNEMDTAATTFQELRDEVQTAHCEAQDLQDRLKGSEGKVQFIHGHFRASREKLKTAQDLLQHSQSQVEALQKDMLSRVEQVRVVSDEQLAQDFRAIVSLVRTLSRSVRLADNADVFEILEPYTLLHNVPQHNWNTRAGMKCYLEAWVWSVLVEMLFSSPFAIFKKNGMAFNRNWTWMFGTGHDLKWPSPSALCETWRTTTMQHLVDLAGSDAITSGQPKQANRYQMTKAAHQMEIAVIEARSHVANVIGEKLASVSTTADVSRISLIIDKATSLVLQMSLQRCRLQITYPKVGTRFVEEQMSPVSDPDGEEVEDGVVAFVVNPGLSKWGDAYGKNFDQRYDIVPALVQLDSISIKHE